METTTRDPQLWRQAKARAKFKAHLFTYIWVNALLWTIWALTDRQMRPLPWPAWATIFWGVGVIAQAIGTYGGWRYGDLPEREYERLLRQKEGR